MQAKIIYKGETLNVIRVSTATKTDDPNVTTAYICELEDGSNVTVLNTEIDGVIEDGQSDSQDSGQPGQPNDGTE